MRRAFSPPPRAIVIPRRLQRLASRARAGIYSVEADPQRDFVTKYEPVPYSTLEDQRHIRRYDAELITATHSGAKALIPYDTTNPLLSKDHVIPPLEALRRERPRTVGLKKHQDVSVLSRAYANMIDRVQSSFFHSGFLRIYDEAVGALAPSEARDRELAQQRMAHYRILQLEYMEHARNLHEHLSPQLADYTNQAERRHRILIQSIVDQSIENLFASLSAQTLYKSVQKPCDDTPVILFQCRLEDIIRGSISEPDLNFKQTSITTLTTNDLVSISELAQAIASEQSTAAQDPSVPYPTIQQSSQVSTDVLTLGRYLSTVLFNEDSKLKDSSESISGPNNNNSINNSDNLSICSDHSEDWELEENNKNCVCDIIIDRLASPKSQLYASQKDAPSPKCTTKQGRRQLLKSPANKMLTIQKYTKSGLPLPQSRLGTQRTRRLRPEADLSSLDHNQYQTVHTTNPILAKNNYHKPDDAIKPLISRPLQSPPLKPRTVSRVSLVRNPSPSVREATLLPKDLQACAVPLTKVTFQLGSPGAHFSEPGTHSIKDPFSESEPFVLDCFDVIDNLPQSQGYHLRSQAPLSFHAHQATQQTIHQDQSNNNLKNSNKGSSPGSPIFTHPTRPRAKLRDRFGSPLLTLSTKQLNLEIAQVLRCREYLMFCISQYRKLALHGDPANYSAGFTYTAWLIEDPINIFELIRSMVPPWPSAESYERMQKIRRISSALTANLPKKLIWMNPAYKEPFHDIQDLCSSILWMLTGDSAPSWYVPNSKAMKQRRADMNRRLLLDIGAIDQYDERQITPGVFTKLVSPNMRLERRSAVSRSSSPPLSRAKTAMAIRSQQLDASDSSHDTTERSNSLIEAESYNAYNATFQEFYCREVPAVRRFHFPKHWIVYGAYLDSSIPHYYESINCVFNELNSNHKHNLISMGPVIERAIKHEKNDKYDSSSSLEYAQFKWKQLSIPNDSHNCEKNYEKSYISNNILERPFNAKQYLMNGGVTPYVSPCFSEFNSFVTVISESNTPPNDRDRNSYSSPSPDSEISILYEDEDIGIKGQSTLQSGHYNSNMSISELTETQEKTVPLQLAAPMDISIDDWTDIFLKHVIHELETYSKEQLYLRSGAHSYNTGHYASLNMQVVSAGKSISGYTQSTTRGSQSTTPHISQMTINRRLLIKANEQHISSPVARILEHPLDFTDEISASKHLIAPTHRTSAKRNKIIERNEHHAYYDSRRLYVMDIHYPNHQMLRKGCYVNLQLLADFSYFKETEERRREIFNAYPMDPDIYIADNTIKAYYDEPLLPRYHFPDAVITSGIHIIKKDYTKPSRSIVFVDGLSDTDLMSIARNKKARALQRQEMPPIYLPFIRTIFKNIGGTYSTELSSTESNIHGHNISTGDILFCKPHDFTNYTSCLQVSQESTPAIDNIQRHRAQEMLMIRGVGRTAEIDGGMLTMCSATNEDRCIEILEQQAFELSDNNLLALFSLRISNVKEIINNLLQWVETMYVVLMLDGRALLSSICGSSYWADITNSSLELEKRSKKERFAAMYRRFLHSRDVKNIPQAAYPEKEQDNAGIIDNLQLFDVKRENAIKFLRLANRMYAESVAEAINHMVCHVIMPAVKSVLCLIVKESMAMIDSARLTVYKYMVYLREVEPEYTILIKINTDYLNTLEYFEIVMSRVFWLFRHVRSADNSLITIPQTSRSNDQTHNQHLRMPKIIIRCTPHMQAAWNVCKLMFIKVRTTLNTGLRYLLAMPTAPTLPKYISTIKIDTENTRRKQHSHVNMVVDCPTSNTHYSTLQLGFSLKKDTQPFTISELSQLKHLLPENSFSGGLHENQLWPYHKYGYYHLLHSVFKHFDDRIEPLEALVSDYGSGNRDTDSDISLIDMEEDYVDEEEIEYEYDD